MFKWNKYKYITTRNVKFHLTNCGANNSVLSRNVITEKLTKEFDENFHNLAIYGYSGYSLKLPTYSRDYKKFFIKITDFIPSDDGCIKLEELEKHKVVYLYKVQPEKPSANSTQYFFNNEFVQLNDIEIYPIEIEKTDLVSSVLAYEETSYPKTGVHGNFYYEFTGKIFEKEETPKPVRFHIEEMTDTHIKIECLDEFKDRFVVEIRDAGNVKEYHADKDGIVLIEDLTLNEKYLYFCYFKETDTHLKSNIQRGDLFRYQSLKLEVPSVPTVRFTMENQIVLESIGFPNAMITCNGETKRSGSKWYNLQPNTEYIAFAFIEYKRRGLRSKNSDNLYFMTSSY